MREDAETVLIWSFFSLFHPALNKADNEALAMRKQAEGLTVEYDRLLKEHGKLQVPRKENRVARIWRWGQAEACAGIGRRLLCTCTVFQSCTPSLFIFNSPHTVSV